MDLLTVAEAAVELRISTTQAYRFIKTKKLKARKLSARCIRVHRSDLLDFIGRPAVPQADGGRPAA